MGVCFLGEVRRENGGVVGFFGFFFVKGCGGLEGSEGC